MILQVGQVSTPAANVAQHLQKTTEAVKMETITTLLLEENQLSESSGHAMPLTIVFVERKARCDEVQPNISCPRHLSRGFAVSMPFCVHCGQCEERGCNADKRGVGFKDFIKMG